MSPRLSRLLSGALLVICVALAAMNALLFFSLHGTSWPGMATALLPVVLLAFPITGFVILSRNQGNRIGWLLQAIGGLILLTIDALESQARKATLPGQVDADGVGRYPQEVEAAVYFCCLEALQNVQKYAAATQATVRLKEDGDIVAFEVEDDGRGFDVGSTKLGSGLTNMSDRLDALGGGLEVDSTPGAGCHLRGRLRAAALPQPQGATV